MTVTEKVQANTRWRSRNGDATVFVVLHVVELDGHVWIHYRDEACPTCHEFSCYEESFLARFSPILNESRV